MTSDTIRSLIKFKESFHQRIGECYVIHPKNLYVKEGVVYLACLYDLLLVKREYSCRNFLSFSLNPQQLS